MGRRSRAAYVERRYDHPRRVSARLTTGPLVLNFVDSFEFNIAAYCLAKLVGLDHMVPVTVRRVWRGAEGSLSWWIDDVMLDERERLAQGVEPSHPRRW